MKMKYILAIGLCLAGLFLLYRVQLGEEQIVNDNRVYTFKFKQPELQKLVEDCWKESMRELVSKGFLTKDPVSWTINNNKVDANGKKEAFDLIFKVVERALEKNGYASSNQNEKNVFKSMLSEMLFSSVMHLYAKPQLFSWCPCVPATQRIVLALNVVNDICSKYKPSKQLRYTSIATGSLLQDFIILQELKRRGFKKIKINLIDPGYFSLSEMKNLKKLMLLPQDKIHADYLQNLAKEIDNHLSEIHASRDRKTVISALKAKQENVELESVPVLSQEDDSAGSTLDVEILLYRFIDTVALKSFIEQITYGSDGAIEVIAWENAQDYFERAKRDSDEQSDVLLMVDPDAGYFVQPPFPSLSNVVRLESANNPEEVVFVMLPQHGKPQVKACNEVSRISPLYKEMKHLIDDSGLTVGKFTTLIADRYNDSTSSTNSPKDAPSLANEVALTNNPKYVPSLASLANKVALANSPKDVPSLASLANKAAFKVTYIIDLYLLAQDMMYEALADPEKAVVYMGQEETQKIIPDEYKKRDIAEERSAKICQSKDNFFS